MACVNILGLLTSLYRWQGTLQRDSEYPLMMKMAANRGVVLIARPQELHPYNVPEILVLPIETGAPSYLNWITEALREQE